MFSSHSLWASGIEVLKKKPVGPLPLSSVLTSSPSGLEELNNSEPVSQLQSQVNSKVSETVKCTKSNTRI